jgi:peptidoglycan/LPS O-acetylase OafA/YrhL
MTPPKADAGAPESDVAEPPVTTQPVRVQPLRARRRFTELDGLRGLAALLVVFFHLRSHLGTLGLPARPLQLIGGGYLMVDLFFVLSGFVLARTMLATSSLSDVVRFSALRARRFLPLHLAALAIAFACVLVTWIAQRSEELGGRAAFTSEQESLWGWTSAALLLQGFVGPHFAGYIAAWSLSIELYTNIALVLAIALVSRVRLRRAVGPAAVLIGAVILTVAGADGENSVGWTAFGRGLTGLGAGLSLFLIFGATRRWPRRVTDVVAVVALGVLLLVVYMAWRLRFLDFLPMVPVAGLLILSLAQSSAGPAHWLLNSAPAQWLGSRSFALYAIHAPILVAVVLACRLNELDPDLPGGALVVVLGTVLGALLAAELGHRYLERLWLPADKHRTDQAAARAR